MDHNANIGVAIVAPSGYAPDEAAYGRGLERLRSAGCAVRDFHVPANRHQRFGGSDEDRVQQLHAAARDPDAQIVMAVRGGYGLSRILPALDLDLLAGSGKLFVGHSDFTALQMALLTRGASSFAGPMVCIDFSRDDPSAFTLDHFWRCVGSRTHAIEFQAPGNPAIEVEGTLWGGNLSMLAHLAGTPWMPRIDGGILFIEDINEHPYRIERMLLQLQYAGLLDQKAILLGDFSGGPLTPYDNGYGFDSMVDYLRGRFGVPILTGLPFGHIRDKATLAVGSRARLCCDGLRGSLQMEDYPSIAD